MKFEWLFSSKTFRVGIPAILALALAGLVNLVTAQISCNGQTKWGCIFEEWELIIGLLIVFTFNLVYSIGQLVYQDSVLRPKSPKEKHDEELKKAELKLINIHIKATKRRFKKGHDERAYRSSNEALRIMHAGKMQNNEINKQNDGVKGILSWPGRNRKK